MIPMQSILDVPTHRRAFGVCIKVLELQGRYAASRHHPRWSIKSAAPRGA